MVIYKILLIAFHILFNFFLLKIGISLNNLVNIANLLLPCALQAVQLKEEN